MCLNALFESDLNRVPKRESNRITAPHNAVLEVRAHERIFWSVFGQSFPSLIVSRLVSSGVVRQQRNRQNEVRKKMRIPSVIGRKKRFIFA